MTVRTRFAPSPTGQVHIGNMRAAIYNWLFARHEGGKFLLRIEDTDRERSTPEAVQAVLDAMDWLGLNHDEDALYQSTQKAAHLAAAEKLLAGGHAYKEDKGGTGKGEAVVFRMPRKDMTFRDEIKGDLKKEAKHLPDFVIVRSDGNPVFHLANVVDDIQMNITHVIRGDDHIENTYRHVAIFQALGAPVPKYAHLPMIVNAQGKPYSKRDGDAFVGDFREKGYLPEALFNYLVLLGWAPGDDREMVSREEMVKLFDITRVKSNPAQLDLKKLRWMNGEYIMQMPKEKFAAKFKSLLAEKGLWHEGISETYFGQVVILMQDRVKLWTDVAELSGFFFTDDYPYQEEAVKKRLQKPGAMDALKAVHDAYAKLDPFTAETTDAALRKLAEQRGVSAGELVHPVRVAVSGLPMGPSLFHMLDVLGKERVLQRMEKTLARFS